MITTKMYFQKSVYINNLKIFDHDGTDVSDETVMLIRHLKTAFQKAYYFFIIDVFQIKYLSFNQMSVLVVMVY